VVREIMLHFAESTGLRGGGEPRRYLWTDAFAVCNYLELYRRTGEEVWRELALHLVDQVHHILGRHRPDSGKSGWISGLNDKEGEMHPTRGGVRIGKLLPERSPHEPPDERLEWERDGQYYHYLTKWMHALNRVTSITGESRYLLWGVELARTAHHGFSHTPSWNGVQLYWKMSVDLSRPQVASMGQHDPLDGLVTCRELESAVRAAIPPPLPELRTETEELSAMCRGITWETDDLLGIGGLLCDAWRIAQLMMRGEWMARDLLEKVLESALRGIMRARGLLDLPSSYRLPFRECGFSTGLHAAERLAGAGLEAIGEKASRNAARIDKYYRSLAEKVENYWLAERNQEAETWREHEEINMVMLATSLAPEQFLQV